MKWLECIPNISEGKDEKKIQAVEAVIRGVPEVFLLGSEYDEDHNRAVLTFVGPEEGVKEAAFRLVRSTRDLIDMSGHKGVHPRIGATDVLPFVPLWGAEEKDAIAAAHEVGKRIGNELDIPVYFYGEAALRKDRFHLADIRRGGLEALRDAIRVDPQKEPDAGPSQVHPQAGATAVGARDFLIAFNIFLKTDDIKLARRIARKVRKLESVKSLGFPIDSRGQVQVSMNLTNYRINSIPQVYRLIEKEARAQGVEIEESELIGLVPSQALIEMASDDYKILNLESKKVIENSLLKEIIDSHFSGFPDSYVRRLASSNPTPGGGSASAVVAALATALVHMIEAISREREEGETEVAYHLEELVTQFRSLSKEDELAYQRVVASNREKKSPEEKQRALEEAASVPLRQMRKIVDLLDHFPFFIENAKATLRPDIYAAYHLLKGAYGAAREMVECNLLWLKGERKENISTTLDGVLHRAAELMAQIEGEIQKNKNS